MSEHELWNELGNLYFISGTLSQAAYAYNRSIQLDSGFGRPYCNLALTYVKQGKFAEAVKLYQRSIDLLVDDREKAITWYRLGDVYRHLKDYRDAIMAYQQADLLDPELGQDRKESGQILYGSSERSAKQVIPQDHAPALPKVRTEPVNVKQEHQAASLAAELPRLVVVLPEEALVSAPGSEPVLEEPVLLSEDAAVHMEQPVVENAVTSEAVGDRMILSNEEMPFGEADTPIPDVPVEAPGASPETLAQETAPLSLEGEPVMIAAPESPPVEPSTMALEEQVDEPGTTPVEEVLVEAADLPGKVIEQVPAVQDEPGSADLPEPAILEEDPAPDFLALDEIPVQEDLNTAAETVADMSSAVWVEEIYPYSEFEHETEVFIPETQEEALDQWLPITEAETFASEAQAESTYVPDMEPFTAETPNHSESLRTSYQPAPLVPQRYMTDAAPSAFLEVDVDVKDEVAQPVFIIPEGIEQEALDDQMESGLADPAVAASSKEDEELKEIEREIERFQQVVQHNPRNASAWDTLGTLYKSAHRYRDAILAYQQAVVVDPSKAPYHHHLGIIYAVEGRDEDAIKAFQEVIEIDPNHNLAHASLGGYYSRMGLEDLAQKHIGRAMKNFYSNENEYNRACMEALCGHTEQSIELLRVALKNKQTYVDWVLRDPDLDSIRRDPRFKQLISDYTA